MEIKLDDGSVISVNKEVSDVILGILEPKGLPKTWDEFDTPCRKDYLYEAESIVNLCRLLELKNYYNSTVDRQGSEIYSLTVDGININWLSFKTKELATEFEKNFHDLILDTGELIYGCIYDDMK